MKFLTILFPLAFAISFSSLCQNPGYGEDTSPPSFDLNFLVITSSDTSKDEFKFLDTKMSALLKEFPSPDKNEDFYFEMDEVMARLIVYGESEFYFLENKLSDFRFQDARFSIGNGESFIKVGDHYSEVEKLYPSYKVQLESSIVENYGRIFITLSNGQILLDDALVIIFDPETKKINEILF